MTKQIDILSSETKNVTITQSKNSKEEVKQEASLFDKLLGGGLKSTSNEKETPNLNKNTIPNESLNTTSNTSTNANKEEVDNSKNLNSDKNSIPAKTTSLLDRLVMEAKKNTDEKNTDIIKKDINKPAENTSSTKIVEDIKVTAVNSNIEEINVKSELKSNELGKVLDNKVETKNTDEIKKDLPQNITKEMSKNAEALVSKENANTSLTNSNIEEIKRKPESEQKLNESIKIIDNKEEIKNTEIKSKDITKNIETLDKSGNTITPKINSDEDKNTLKTISLLDRLVSEAKNTTEDKKEVISKDTAKNVENSIIKQSPQATQTAQLVVPNSQIEEITVKQELKTNELTKIIDNKVEIKSSDVTNKNDVKNIETSVTTQFLQSAILDSEVEKINIKAEVKTNEMGKVVENNNEETNIKANENNTKLTKDLSLLTKDSNLNEKINITKAEIESLPMKQKEETKSLMDSLIDKTKISKDLSSLTQEESKTLKNTNITSNSKDVISNIYLSSQRNSINNSALSNKTEAINTVKNATTTSEVEVSAKKLDLNVKEISLESNRVEIKKDAITLIDRKNSLDKLFLDKNARHNEVNTLITKSVEASKVILENTKEIENEISLTVNPLLAQNIQAKIIGARQQMSSMMSEVARQMYENYKPPVTAFRINLTPGALGSIAIIMKSDKDSGINISLNISNSATLDAFIDSQNSLKNALNKTFEDGTEFNLNFSSNDENNNKSDNQENTNQSFTNQTDTQSILESREKNLESEDRNLDYM